MYRKELMRQGHTTTFSVTENQGEGWEVRVEEDSRLVHRARYTDWHRVERAVSRLSVDVMALENRGWREKSPA